MVLDYIVIAGIAVIAELRGEEKSEPSAWRWLVSLRMEGESLNLGETHVVAASAAAVEVLD